MSGVIKGEKVVVKVEENWKEVYSWSKEQWVEYEQIKRAYNRQQPYIKIQPSAIKIAMPRELDDSNKFVIFDWVVWIEWD